jgi:hypothetical protein
MFQVKAKVKLLLCLIKCHILKMYGKMEVWFNAFLTSWLDGGEWSASHPSCFTPRENAPHYPLDRRLNEPYSQTGCCEDDKNLLKTYNKYVPSCVCRCILVGAIGFCTKCLLLHHEGEPNWGSNVRWRVQSKVGTFHERCGWMMQTRADVWLGSAETKPDCTDTVHFVSSVSQNYKAMIGSRRVKMLSFWNEVDISGSPWED